MLGRMVSDPDGIEGDVTETQGLGLLDIETIMEPAKTVRNSEGWCEPFGTGLTGYEIHLGRTTGPDCARPFSTINAHPDGAVSETGRIMGTYLHGLFGNDDFRRVYLERLGIAGGGENYRATVDAALDQIADRLEALISPDFPALEGSGPAFLTA